MGSTSHASSNALAATTAYLYYVVYRHQLHDDALSGEDSSGAVSPDTADGGATNLSVDAAQNVYETFAYKRRSKTGVRVFNPDLTLRQTIELPSGTVPLSVASDPQGEIYVGVTIAQSMPAIEVFAADARGPAIPIRTITGVNTELSSDPSDIKIDESGFAYVLNVVTYPPAGSILVFAPDANGNEAPLREIAGAATFLRYPEQLALGADHNIYVANEIGWRHYNVLVFPESADGDVAPLWRLRSQHYGQGIALGNGGTIYLSPARGRYRGDYIAAIYAPGASGDAHPIGYVRPGVTKGTLPYRIALQYPWMP